MDPTSENEEKSYRPQKRAGHVSVVVGKFLFLWGGFSDEVHSSTMYEARYLPPGEMWVYHTDTDQWISVICNGHPPPGLSGANAVIVNDGLYILFGHSGRLGRMNSVWRMDLMTKAWEEVHPKEDTLRPSPRDKGVAWSHNNKLFAFGGYGYHHKGFLVEHGSFYMDDSALQTEWWNNQLLEFDLEQKQWKDIKCSGDVPSPRAAHAVDMFENSSEVYLFGGRFKDKRLNDLHRFDHDTHKWTRLIIAGPEPEGRSWHTFTAIPPKYFLLVGGYSTEFEPLRDVWVLDAELLQWREVSPQLSSPRLWHTAAVTCDNEVLVYGGCCNDILNEDVNTEYTNELVTFVLAPKSLLRLCLDAAFKHRVQLASAWDNLPKNLSQVLTMRQKGLSCDLLNRTQYQVKRQGRSCVIS